MYNINMLYEITDGSVTIGDKAVLSHFNFEIRGNEKIAVVGRNGAGKTTLLNVISGDLPLDSNEKNSDSGIRRSRAFTMGVLRQQAVQDPDRTVEEEVLENVQDDLFAQERYDFEQRYDRIFTRFGFSLEDKGKRLGDFSGGEQTKIMLIKLLLQRPDLLILDEPTNHLDVESLHWLEEYIRSYPGAVVMVSHDRYFLDRTAQVIWEITNGKLIRYAGNYTQYREARTKNYVRQLRAWKQQQDEVDRLNRLITKFKNRPRKAAFARSRKKILDRMDRMEKPDPDEAVIHTGEIQPSRRGSKLVFSCEDLQIGYDTENPLREISFRMQRGQKIGIIGPNGTGKSTFLKTVAGELPPLKGKLQIGENIDPAFFDQMTAALSSDKTVINWFGDQFPELRPEEVRRILAGYLFHSSDMGKKISQLSGGEKARLMLAALLQPAPNFLILDEPTNNMDIPAKETLESIFLSYQGTILFVSHDRYFLSRVADSLLIFRPGTKQVLYYPADYDHYVDYRAREAAGTDPDLLRSTQEQKFIESFRNVPKGEHHQLHELSQKEQELNWKLDLNRRTREPAEETFKNVSEKLERIRNPQTLVEYEEQEEKLCTLEPALESARDAWTRELLGWYDIWQEYH